MRLRFVLATLFIGSAVVAAQPTAPPPPEAPPEPPTEPATPTEPAPAPAPIVTTPPGVVPPITINITNNNTGNNSNTNTQTNTAPVTVSTPVDVSTTTSTPVTVSTPVTTSTTTTVAPIAPPGLVDTNRGRHPTIERVGLIAPAPKIPRWLAIGITGGDGAPGVRAQIDLFRRGRFSLGVAANASGHGHGHGHHGEGDRDEGGAASAVVYVAYTKQLGRFQMRAQIGVGAELADDDDRDGGDNSTIARTVDGNEDPAEESGRRRGSPRAEAALLVALPLTNRLGLVAGPILSASRHDTDDRMAETDRRHDRPEVDARFMAGLRLGF